MCEEMFVLRLMKLTLTLFTITLGLVFSLASAKDSPDSFSGKWVLDKHAPRPGDAPNSLQTKIKQDGSGFTFESTFKEPKSGVVPLLYLTVMTDKLHLNTDGQETHMQIGPFMTVFKSTMDGNKLITDWKAQINGAPVQGHWVHTLSDDGKHMTLELQESSRDGQHEEATLNFVRK